MPSKTIARLWRSRWLRVAFPALAAVLALFITFGLWMTHHAEPLVRSSILEALQQHFRSRVELDAFRFTFHHPSLMGGTAVAEMDGLRIWLPEPDQEAAQLRSPQPRPTQSPGLAQPWFHQPWITIQQLRFTASLGFLLGGPLRLSNVQVQGVRLLIPPKGYRPRLTTAQVAHAPPPQASLIHAPQVQVDQITCRNVFLEMERMPARDTVSRQPGFSVVKPPAGTLLLTGRTQHIAAELSSEQSPQVAKKPLQFQIASLILNPGPQGTPIRFRLQMINPRPVGVIFAAGFLGPWSVPATGGRFDPGALPLRGSYSFNHANLATIHGIAGMLNSTGTFTGILRQVRVDGQSSTPDFRLTRHGVIPPDAVGLPLWTRFKATVDGTNGNTVLDKVEASLGKTHFWASGQILRVQYLTARQNGSPMPRIGHDVQLQVRVDRGQISDLLQVATANPSPLVTGAVTLTNSLHLPPGEESLRTRLVLDGNFHAMNVHFASQRIEHDLTQLSLRGQGHPQALHNGPDAPVTSAMSGHFALVSGVFALPALVFQVPGAQIHLHGTYALEGDALDFSGDAQMQASLSQMVGGWKGMLLSPINRVFAKNGAGTDVPIHLTGTRTEPHLTIDFGRIGKSGPPPAPSSPVPGTQP